jgi:2'-5' RNA ligase
VSPRLFVALDVPAAVRARLAGWCAAAAPEGVRQVPAENLHITLAFLGSRSAAEADAVASLLPAVARAGRAGTLETAGALWLPPRRPGVLTVAIAHDDGLRALRAALVDALRAAIGFGPERRPFRPHVTVARVARGARVAASALDPPPGLRFEAEAVMLYRSHTVRAGARYEALARCAVARDGAPDDGGC